MHRKVFFTGVACLLGLALTSGCTDTPDPEQSHFYALGTQVMVISRHDIHQVTDQVETLARQWEQDWDPWGSGQLGEVNRALEKTGSSPLPAELVAGISESLALSRASGGLFHPGMGQLVEAWGFHRQPMPDNWEPPGEARLATLLTQLPSPEALMLSDERLTSQTRTFRLELGGIAKGRLLNEIKATLAPTWPEGALINLGGDVLAIGQRAPDEGRAWRIGILDPRAEGVLAGLDMRDGECATTSGDYERTQHFKGSHYHHLLDPRTGSPARHSASVTVVDHDCARADAAATALFVAGPGHWPEIASNMGVSEVMLVSPDGHVELSPSLAERLDFPNRQPIIIERDLR